MQMEKEAWPEKGINNLMDKTEIVETEGKGKSKVWQMLKETKSILLKRGSEYQLK